MKARFASRFWELLLLSTGLLLLSVVGFRLFRSYVFEKYPAWVSAVGDTEGPDSSLTALRHRYLLRPIFNSSTVPFRVTGRLEIPRLKISVLVVDGNEEEALAVASAHLAGSAPIGTRGNTVIAAHRDTAFWPLRNVRLGDRVRLKAAKTYEYAVSSIRIVSPNDISVLRKGDIPMLTMITCYPFRYIGSAPQRYVVQAQRTSY